MKLRILSCVTVSIIIATAIFGIIKRQTYTDIANEEDYLEQLHIAELAEERTIEYAQIYPKELEKAPIVLRVMVTEEIEHLFGTGRQKVKVQEIYEGDDLEVGEEIYLTSRSWHLNLGVWIDSIERGFVNVMKAGSEYLVFVSGELESLEKSIPVYGIYHDSFIFIAPVFCYEDITNISVEPTSVQHNYVPYAEVKDNEFFGESEGALNAWAEMKEKIMSAYPKG